jgi:hypothetical protein
MGRKIFITYKYGDTQVEKLKSVGDDQPTKVRHYVDSLQDLLQAEDHINKGEADGESLADFKDSTIESKLRDKIFDSSITIAIVSKGMKESALAEKDQWMPWEISYSLKEHSRDGRTSYSNAMLAVVLPDENGNYDYYIVEMACPYCKCRTLKTEILFQILRDNMFNIKKPVRNNCTNHDIASRPYVGDSSYIPSVKWSDFTGNIDSYLDKACSINEKIDEYNIEKTVK